MYKNLEYWKDKVAIVTGAGGDIGAEIAQHLINIGMVVIGFETSEDRVARMCEKFALSKGEGQLVPCKCNVFKEEDLKTAFEGIVELYGGVDVLINNAAIGKDGRLLSTEDINNDENVLDVNVKGLMACPRFAIQSMSKKKVHGLIININSICGHSHYIDEPIHDLYLASHKTITVVNKLLREELKSLQFKVRVTSISPGIVRTGIFKTAEIKFPNEEFFENNPHLETRDVSNIVLMILAAPRTVQINEVVYNDLYELC